MAELPWLLRIGGVAGPLLLLLAGVALPLGVAAAHLLRARRSATRKARKRFDAPSSLSVGRRTLAGRLEAPADVPLLDGRVHGVVASSRFDGVASVSAPGLVLRVGEESLPLRGDLEVVLGSCRDHLRAPRPHRIDWLRAGDEVLAAGEVVPDWSAGSEGYREQADAWMLEATEHTPLRLMARRRPRLWGFAVPSTMALYAGLTLVATLVAPLVVAGVATSFPVFDRSDDSVTISAVVTSLSPINRRSTLRRLIVALDEPTLPGSHRRDEAQRALLTELDEPRLAAWLHSRHGRWDDAADAARRSNSWLRAGWYAWAAGDVEGASEAFSQLMTYRDEDSLREVAFASHLLAGRLDEAEELARRWDGERDQGGAVRRCVIAAARGEAVVGPVPGGRDDDDVRFACAIAFGPNQAPGGLRLGRFAQSAVALSSARLSRDWPRVLMRPDGSEPIVVRDEPRASAASKLAYRILLEALNAPLPSDAERLDETAARIDRIESAKGSGGRLRMKTELLEALFAPWVARMLVANEAVMALHAWGRHDEARALMDRTLGWARRLRPAAELLHARDMTYGVDGKWLGKVLRVLNLTYATDLTLRLRRHEPMDDDHPVPWSSSHVFRCLQSLPGGDACEADAPTFRSLAPSHPLDELRGSHPHLVRRRLSLRVALADEEDRRPLTPFLRHGPRWWDSSLTPLAWAPYDCNDSADDCYGGDFSPVGDPLVSDVRDGAFVLGVPSVVEAEQRRHDRLYATLRKHPLRAWIAAVAIGAP